VYATPEICKISWRKNTGRKQYRKIQIKQYNVAYTMILRKIKKKKT